MDTIARGVAVAARSRANQLAATRKIPLPARVRTQEVMASPPTITFTTTNPIASPFNYPSVWPGNGGTTNRINPLFRYRKVSSPVIAGTVSPNYFSVKFTSVNAGPTGGQVAVIVGIPVLTDASRITFLVKGLTGQITAKVDGQYVSLTPTTIPNDGNFYYYDLNFGSSKMREIEVIVTGNTFFNGVYVAATDTVAPAPARGPKTIVIWDSFGEGTGATTLQNRATTVFGDALGWDDVRPDAVGSTGLLATSGDKLTYRQRLATDVIPYAPELVVICTSINDVAQTPAAMSAEAQLTISTLKAALPNVQIVMTSMMANKGAGHMSANSHLVTDALSALASSNGIPFINLTDQPLPDYFTATPTTLFASALAGATSLRVTDVTTPGATYKFADGSHVFVRSSTFTAGAYTLTIDGLQTAQANGAVLTPCGNSLWVGAGCVGATTGLGNTDVVVGADTTHPTDLGHQMIGAALAYGVLRVL